MRSVWAVSAENPVSVGGLFLVACLRICRLSAYELGGGGVPAAWGGEGSFTSEARRGVSRVRVRSVKLDGPGSPPRLPGHRVKASVSCSAEGADSSPRPQAASAGSHQHPRPVLPPTAPRGAVLEESGSWPGLGGRGASLCPARVHVRLFSAGVQLRRSAPCFGRPTPPGGWPPRRRGKAVCMKSGLGGSLDP